MRGWSAVLLNFSYQEITVTMKRSLYKNSFGKGSKKAQDESKGFYFITEKDILEQFLSRFFNKEWKSSFLIMIIERDLVDSQQTPNIMIIIIWKIYKYGVLEI